MEIFDILWFGISIQTLKFHDLQLCSFESDAGLRKLLCVKVITTTSTEAAKRKIKVPRTIMAIRRWRLACSSCWVSSIIFCVCLILSFVERTDSFREVAMLALRGLVFLLTLALLSSPEVSTSSSHINVKAFSAHRNWSMKAIILLILRGKTRYVSFVFNAFEVRYTKLRKSSILSDVLYFEKRYIKNITWTVRCNSTKAILIRG